MHTWLGSAAVGLVLAAYGWVIYRLLDWAGRREAW